MARFHRRGNADVPFTPAEEAARDAEEAAWSPTTEEDNINQWLKENRFAAALILGLNRPVTDPNHIPVNTGLDDFSLIGKIKANLK